MFALDPRFDTKEYEEWLDTLKKDELESVLDPTGAKIQADRDWLVEKTIENLPKVTDDIPW